MANPTRHSRLGLIVNAALVALAFGLLAVVIWRNADDIRKVFSRRLDLSLLGWALAVYLTGMVGTFVRWFFLVRVIEPKFTLRATLLLGFDRHGLQPGDSGCGRRRFDQGGLPGPDADQENAGDRFDGDRPDPRAARRCSSWRRSPAGSPGDWQKVMSAS